MDPIEPFEWKSSFELGVNAIDDEHRDLFDRAGRLHAVVEQGNMTQCAVIADEILVAAQRHFENEEAFLERVGYPDRSGHKVFHEQLRAQVQELRTLCGAGADMPDVWACYAAVLAFLIDDVVGGDIKFKSYLIEHGYSGRRGGDTAPL